MLLLFREAFEALSDNRFRSVLSLFGVAIGIASIIVVSSIATSGKEMVFNELETFGLRTFWVYRNTASDDRLEKDAGGTGITTADYKDILKRSLPAVSKLSPVVEGGGKVIASRNSHTLRVRLQGVNQAYNQINGDTVSLGRFFSSHDLSYRLNVAVVGPAVLESLFPLREDVIGKTISIGEDWFQIIGILEEKSRDLIMSLGAVDGEDSRARILVPYTTRQKMLADSDFVNYLQGQAIELNHATDAVNSIIGVLNLRHRGAYRYKGETMSTYVSTANNILGAVSVIGIAAATVSLLVGGLAILNIMTTSVIERTKEIGLRRAIGASQSDIKIQFLLEAVLISAAGGGVGILLGIGTIQIAPLYSEVAVEVNPYGVVLAMLSTFIVGLASGYYPAQRASKLEPVEALRHE